MTELLFQEVPIDEAYETPLNNRRTFNAAALAELTESVRTKGILTPLVMRRQPKGDDPSRGFEILAGARRYRAALAAGLLVLPARIGDFTDGEALEIVVIENLQREDLHPLEEAEGYRALLDRPDYDVAAIALKVGKSESYIYQRLKLLDLIPEAHKAFLADDILLSHAQLLAPLQPKDQKEALEHCLEREHGSKRRHAGSARALSRWIDDHVHLELKKAVFPTEDAALVPAAGPCSACPKRSGSSPALFPHLDKRDVCTDPSCYGAKVRAFLDATKARVETERGAAPVELSTEHYDGRNHDKATLLAGEWTEVKAKGPQCEYARPGVIMERGWHQDRELGTVLTVCTNKKCTVHRGTHGSSHLSPAERSRRQNEKDKQRQKAATHQQWFAAFRGAVPSKLQRAELDRLTYAYLQVIDVDSCKRIAAFFEVEVPKVKTHGYEHYDYRDSVTTWALALADAELARLLILLPLARAMHAFDWEDEAAATLQAAATAYGVDLKAIERGVVTEFKAKQKVRADKQKAAARKQAKPKTNVKASKPTKATRAGKTKSTAKTKATATKRKAKPKAA